MSDKQEILAYIPMDRRQAMANGYSLPEFSTGSVMFADISGFTALTVKLTQALGQKFGAETLTQQLNNIYDQLVTSVHRYSGSVITYAGDAMTCWFEGDDGQLALGCAFMMQEAMRAFESIETPDGGTVSLSIKVSIVTGSARRFLIGRREIQLVDVLAGKTLDVMAKAEKLAERREVVVDEETASRFTGLIMIKEWRTVADHSGRFAVLEKLTRPIPEKPWPELPDVFLEAETDHLDRWLLPPVYDRLAADQGDFLTETRPAAILFHNFQGFDFDNDPETPEKLDRFIQAVQQLFSRFEGQMLQLIIGDKGSFLYGAFGAPIAHDDDMARAVAAGKALQELSLTFPYVTHPKTGISYGQVLTGPYGGTRRRTYGLLGSEVNIAARFMSEAVDAQILVRQVVADAIADFYRTRQMGQVYVKGIHRSLAAYEVRERIPTEVTQLPNQFTTQLVGRDDELAQIGPYIGKLNAERRGLVLKVSGSAGVGKSHLSAELTEIARQNGIQSVLGRCQSMTRTQPFHPWRQILRSLLGIPAETALQQKSRTALARQVAQLQVQITFLNPDWGLRLPLLGDILGIEIPDNPTTAQLEPKQRQEALFALVTEMLTLWAEEQPLLILFDDINWMDELSVALTVAVAQASLRDPIGLILMHRPQKESVFDFSEQENYLEIDLAPLSRQAIGRMLDNLLNSETAPLIGDIVNYHAQGNPYFAGELLSIMYDSGLIRQSDNFWSVSSDLLRSLALANCLERNAADQVVLKEGAQLPENVIKLPDSIYGSILARLDQLTEVQKLTLKVASVVGYQFDINLVNQVHPNTHGLDQIKVLTENLVNQDYIFKQPAEEESAIYYFKQGTTRDVAYDTLLNRQKLQLHRSIADTIQRLSFGDIEEIAYHAFLGQSWDVALQAYWQSAKRARQMYANGLALQHIKKAHTCFKNSKSAPDRTLQRDMFLLLGELWLDTGEYDKCESVLTKAEFIASRMNKAGLDTEETINTHARIFRLLARLKEHQGEYDEALKQIEAGKALVAEHSLPELVELQLFEGLIYSRQGKVKEAQHMCLDAIELADDLEDQNVTARGYTLLGHLARMAGDGASSVDYQTKALQIYQQTSNKKGEGIVQNQLANGYFQVGRWEDASDFYLGAISRFQQMGDLYNEAFAHNNLGQLYLYQGRYRKSQERFETALDMLQKLGASQYVLGVVRMNLGAVAVERLELEAAEEQFSIAARFFEEAGVRDFLSELNRHQAELALRLGDLGDARRLIKSSISHAQELGMRQELGIAWRVCGQVALASKIDSVAIEMLEKSIAILKELDDRYELAKSNLVMANLLINGDSERKFARHIKPAYDTFEALNAEGPLAEARELILRFRHGRDQDRPAGVGTLAPHS